MILHEVEPAWQPLLPDAEATASGIIASVFTHLGQEWQADIALVLSNDAQVQQMNAEFRGKDKPTNVLSFPSDEDEAHGDIIMALETMQREAEEQGKRFGAHFAHLLVHGVLHLLGYDHIEPEEAEIMEEMEIAILASHSIANPYE